MDHVHLSLLIECFRNNNLSEFNRILNLICKNHPNGLFSFTTFKGWIKMLCLEDIANSTKREDIEIVKRVLPFREQYEECTCYYRLCKNGYPSFLYLAVIYLDVELIDILITREKYCKPKRQYRNWKGKHIIIPFHYIAERNPVDAECSRILDYFLNKGLTIDDKEELTGFSLIHISAMFGNTEIIPLILERNGDINAVSEKGLTALHVAIMYKQHDFVSRLLTAGAELNIQDKKQRTPLCLALITGNRNIIQLIMRYVMLNQLTNNHSSLVKSNHLFRYCAAVTGMKIIVEMFLNEGEESDSPIAESGKTMLHYAAENGHTDIVKLLLQRKSTSTGVRKFIRNEIGYTPLHYATLRGHEEIVQLLLKHNANPDVLSKSGETLLHTAVKSGSISITEIILNSTISTDILMKPTINGYTPLHIAIENCYEKIVALLLENGASIECKTKTGLLPIHFAVEKSNINILNMLLRKGASLEPNNTSGPSIFHYALDKNSDQEMIRFLLMCGVDFCCKNDNNFTPLQRCLHEKNDLNLFRLLLEYGAEINISCKAPLYQHCGYSFLEEESLILYATRFKKCEAVNILLEYDIDINLKNSLGQNPFLSYVIFLCRLLRNYPHKLIDSDTDFQKEDEHIPFRIIVRSLARYMAILEARKCYIDEDNLIFINDPYVKSYYEICQQEIELMKSIASFKKITYFDILIENEFKLETFTVKNQIMEAFSNKEYLELFPQYAVYLESSLKKGLKRKYLTERSFNLLEKALQFSLPDICTYHILDYLSSIDLIHFGAAFYLNPPVINLNYVGGKPANTEQKKHDSK